MKHSEGFLKLVNEAKKNIREVTIGQVKARLEAGEKLRLVDVREDHEWEAGRIKGAEHLGRGIIERDAESKFTDKSAEIILYCGGGFRSALAADNLRKMGYTGVVSMDGGWRGWLEAGGPTEK